VHQFGSIYKRLYKDPPSTKHKILKYTVTSIQGQIMNNKMDTYNVGDCIQEAITYQVTYEYT